MPDRQHTLSATLSCNHEINFGTVGVTTSEIERHVPRRKNGTFAAILCPYGCGRRRVVFTTSRWTRNA